MHRASPQPEGRCPSRGHLWAAGSQRWGEVGAGSRLGSLVNLLLLGQPPVGLPESLCKALLCRLKTGGQLPTEETLSLAESPLPLSPEGVP